MQIKPTSCQACLAIRAHQQADGGTSHLQWGQVKLFFACRQEIALMVILLSLNVSRFSARAVASWVVERLGEMRA